MASKNSRKEFIRRMASKKLTELDNLVSDLEIDLEKTSCLMTDVMEYFEYDVEKKKDCILWEYGRNRVKADIAAGFIYKMEHMTESLETAISDIEDILKEKQICNQEDTYSDRKHKVMKMVTNVKEENVTVASWFETWMTEYKANNITASTIQTYRHIFDSHIRP